MGRVFGQPPTVLRYEKTILAVEETTSAGRCGSSLVAVRRRAFFYLLKGVKEYEFEIYLPQLWDTFRL